MKPLDLEGINEKAFEFFCELLFDTKHPRDITEWSDIGKIGGEHGIDAEEIEEIVDFVTNEIKQRIKQACKFYLRYKNVPELLIREQAEHAKLLGDMLAEYYKQEFSCDELWDDFFDGGIITLKTAIEHDARFDYNERLFRFTFKSILEDERI